MLAAGLAAACQSAAEPRSGGSDALGADMGRAAGGGSAGNTDGGQDGAGGAEPRLDAGPDAPARDDGGLVADSGSRAERPAIDSAAASADGGGDAGAVDSASDASTVDGSGGDASAGEGGQISQETGLLKNPMLAFPNSIKDTGVFLSPPDFTQRPDRVRAYTPSPELWSDGLSKERFILLPAGTKVDTSDPKKWAFPVGTIFIKTFSDDGPTAGSHHPVETRFIRKTSATGWEFVAYRWNAAGTEAALVDNANMTRVPVEVTLGGNKLSHDIPSNSDCRDCHMANRMSGIESPPRAAFIGFDELRLNSKREASATKVQLEELFSAGLLSDMPTAPATITDPNPVLLRVKRFVQGNCVHCHHGDGAFDLRPDVFVANTVKQMTDASGVTPPPGYLRIVPGQPEKSVVYLQVRRTMLPNTLKPMPPVGVLAPPPDELANLQTWINSLPP